MLGVGGNNSVVSQYIKVTKFIQNCRVSERWSLGIWLAKRASFPYHNNDVSWGSSSPWWRENNLIGRLYEERECGNEVRVVKKFILE
ncbi:hypothetical protein TNCV_224641 [Trichonephila clavipes]|nr:hypothetical protein TNCV_224641 [Trichonephila clavipes]